MLYIEIGREECNVIVNIYIYTIAASDTHYSDESSFLSLQLARHNLNENIIVYVHAVTLKTLIMFT